MFSIKFEFLPFITSYHYFESIIYYVDKLEEQLQKISFIFSDKEKVMTKKLKKFSCFILLFY